MAPKNRYSTTLGKDLPQVKSNSELRRGGVEFTLRYKNKVGRFKLRFGIQRDLL